ncbi:MAG TPA: hypothetical protein VE954_15085 [Oligoflexus sp.]|uniref:hypothetical protein n=1 Tax=Oligoflexus sp. TaxID=1971216 RepID=UPI002D2D89A9|nr:hypothetical protein [Oligoflexus sp.]HYX34427.1 hypothetical protein [Oligoflexus sp.]
MSSSTGSVNHNIKNLLDRAQAAGISIEPTASRFSQKLLDAIDVSPEHTSLAKQIVGALERTLNRSHDDARLVLSLCLSLQEFSGLVMPDLLKKIEKAIKFLDKPAPATVVRTIKNSAAAALHPKVIDLHDLDSITALSKAPQDSISLVAGKKEILRVGTEEINLTTSGKREIEAAVRKVKAEAKKSSGHESKKAPARPAPAPVDEEGPEMALDAAVTDFDEDDVTFSDELPTELDEAALALSKLLRSMPRKGKLSNVAHVIEEARKLLEHTRRDLEFSRQQDVSNEPVYGDLN